METNNTGEETNNTKREIPDLRKNNPRIDQHGHPLIPFPDGEKTIYTGKKDIYISNGMKIVTILTLQDKIKEAEDEMEELKKGMEEVEKKMEKVENEEEALTKKIVNLFGEHQRKFNVDKLKEEFRNKIEKIFRSKINAPYFDLDFELNEISKEIARDKEKVDEYNTLKDRYNALKDEYDTLEDRYNILKSWITEIEEEKKITEAMEKTEALISEYVEINTDFDTLYHAFHKNN